MCRYIAKNIVAAGMAERCEIQVAYTIGKAEPLSLMVNTYDTGVVPSIDMTKMVIKEFDMRPAAIVEQLDLLRPIYKKPQTTGISAESSMSLSGKRPTLLKNEEGLIAII